MDAATLERKQDRRGRRVLKRQFEILDAAKALFLDRSFGDVTMEEIADQAALSRATLYQYFPTKNDIYGSLVLRDMHLLAGSMIEAFHPDLDLPKNLTKISEAYFAFFASHEFYFTKFSFFYLPGREVPIPDELATAIEGRLSEAIAVIERCLENGIRRGEARSFDTRSVTLALWGQWMGCAYATITGHTQRYGRRLDAVAAAGIDAMLKGLLHPRNSPSRRPA